MLLICGKPVRLCYPVSGSRKINTRLSCLCFFCYVLGIEDFFGNGDFVDTVIITHNDGTGVVVDRKLNGRHFHGIRRSRAGTFSAGSIRRRIMPSWYL